MKTRTATAIALSATLIATIFAAPPALAKTTKNTAKGATEAPAASESPATGNSSSAWRSPGFKRLDANNDGKISLEEFVKDRDNEFKMRDANKDGSLSPDEFDFPPGMQQAQKDAMRKRMQDSEAQRQKMMEEMQAHRAEEMKKMQEERKAATEKKAGEKQSEAPRTEDTSPAAGDEKQPPAQ